MLDINIYKKIKNDEIKGIEKYPSAELLQEVCYKDYSRVLSNYDKIYDKINICLAFYTAILFLIINRLDISFIFNFSQLVSCNEKVLNIINLIVLIFSAIFGVISIIKLLLLLKSKEIFVFDSISIRNNKIYDMFADEASLWVIDKYTEAISEIKNVTDKKQRSFNYAIIFIGVSLILYIISIFLEKFLEVI